LLLRKVQALPRDWNNAPLCFNRELSSIDSEDSGTEDKSLHKKSMMWVVLTVLPLPLSPLITIAWGNCKE
jgi:hypothetical protein